MLKLPRPSGLAIAVVATLLLTASSAFAQASANATGNGHVIILEAVTLTEDVELHFGTLFPDALLTGDVTVTQAGAQSCDATLTCFADAVAGEFTATGSPDRVLDVAADASFTLSGAGTDMTASTDFPAQVTLDGTGSITFNVGGTLTVGANQTPDTYDGTYAISVTYN